MFLLWFFSIQVPVRVTKRTLSYPYLPQMDIFSVMTRHCVAHHPCRLDRDLQWHVITECDRFKVYFSTLWAPTISVCCFSFTLTVQHSSSSAYRVGQAVRLQRRLWRGGLLRAPEQRCSAGRGEKEQQEATFFYLSHHVPQTHASSSPSAPLHGNQRASPHQLQQPHSSRTNRRDQWGAFL